MRIRFLFSVKLADIKQLRESEHHRDSLLIDQLRDELGRIRNALGEFCFGI